MSCHEVWTPTWQEGQLGDLNLRADPAQYQVSKHPMNSKIFGKSHDIIDLFQYNYQSREKLL